VVEHEVGIDRRTLPPELGGRELEDREVQVRRVRRRVAGRADITQDVRARNELPVADAFRVTFQVRVVVAEAPARIELVDRVAAGLAEKQFRAVACRRCGARRTRP
jgi:hypothetical protein